MQLGSFQVNKSNSRIRVGRATRTQLKFCYSTHTSHPGRDGEAPQLSQGSNIKHMVLKQQLHCWLSAHFPSRTVACVERPGDFAILSSVTDRGAKTISSSTA